ncbi:MAG TPA: hypothetical protein VII72_19210 [Myxococcota bacterium]|jgi:predicted small secreted protein
MKSVALSIVAALALSIVACREEGAGERAGQKIDEAVEDAGEAVEDAGEAVEDAAEEAKKKTREALE